MVSGRDGALRDLRALVIDNRAGSGTLGHQQWPVDLLFGVVEISGRGKRDVVGLVDAQEDFCFGLEID